MPKGSTTIKNTAYSQ